MAPLLSGERAMTITTRHQISGDGGEYIFGNAEDDVIDGGPGRDYLVGGGGADTYVFRRGDGQDYLIGFESGVDKPLLVASPRTVSFEDTPQGMKVWYGSLGKHVDSVLLVHVHDIDPTDFLWS